MGIVENYGLWLFNFVYFWNWQQEPIEPPGEHFPCPICLHLWPFFFSFGIFWPLETLIFKNANAHLVLSRQICSKKVGHFAENRENEIHYNSNYRVMQRKVRIYSTIDAYFSLHDPVFHRKTLVSQQKRFIRINVFILDNRWHYIRQAQNLN